MKLIKRKYPYLVIQKSQKKKKKGFSPFDRLSPNLPFFFFFSKRRTKVYVFFEGIVSVMQCKQLIIKINFCLLKKEMRSVRLHHLLHIHINDLFFF
jgi:hypothetical protein